MLPSLPLLLYKGLPSCAGVYFAIADNQVLYIGESIDIAHRWRGHHRRQQLYQCGEVRIAWQECVKDKRWIVAIQDELVALHNPPLNGTVSRFLCHLNERPWYTFPNPGSRPIREVTASVNKAIAWKMRQLMAEKKLTNEDVAEELNRLTGRDRHINAISRWRQADDMPKIDGVDLEALTAVLGCSLDQLLGRG